MESARKLSDIGEALGWRQLLVRRKNETLNEEYGNQQRALVELTPEGTGEISKHRLHPGDLASDNQEVETLDLLSARNLRKLQRIEEAIDRVDRGEFGLCLNCGDEIPVERLKAIPETPYCVSCEGEIEQTGKQFAVSAIPRERRAEEDELKRLGELRVSDVMHEEPVSVREDESLATVVKLMTENKIRHLPVVDEEGDIRGIISDRDLLVLTLRTPRQLDSFLNDKTAAHVMTRSPETVGPDTSLSEAGNYLLDQKISCLPVVEGDHLVGILTESDFVKLVS